MEINTKKAERIQNIKDATNFIEPNKVPTAIYALTWAFAYGGTTYKAVMDDPVQAAKAFTKFYDDIEFDWTMASRLPIPVGVHEILKSNRFYLAEDDTCIAHGQGNDNYISEQDYDLLIKDPDYVKDEILFKKTFKIFNEPKDVAYEAMKKALMHFKKFNEMNNLITQRASEKGLVTLGENLVAPSYSASFNQLFDVFRGIKNSLVDMRRIPDKVEAACDAIFEKIIKNYKTDIEEIKKDISIAPLPMGRTIYHSECFLSPKNYDKFYFNNFKKYCEPYMQAGAKYFVLGEGAFLDKMDRFRSLPKGSLIIMLDQDDPFKAHKVIGDWQTLCTGISQDLLKYGTKQQCIDYVKKCYDTFAPGGGFIFMHNKLFISKNDVNNDNLLAVYQFANEYGKK